MSFIPDTHAFAPRVDRQGSLLKFADHQIELLFNHPRAVRGFELKRIRRSNADVADVDPWLWEFGQARPLAGTKPLIEAKAPVAEKMLQAVRTVGAEESTLCIVPLHFKGLAFTKKLASECTEEATRRLLEFFRSGARLHLAIAVNEEQRRDDNSDEKPREKRTNLFLKLNYRLPR